jgi:CDGSH-type Zn-finger protein
MLAGMTDPTDRPSASVTMYPDGPLIVRGNFVVRDVDGRTVVDGGPVALCRCGRSALKPFCDGSHKVTKRRTDARRDGATS